VTETNVFELTQPETFSDPLTEVLRNGARTLLGQAVEAEVAAWLSTRARDHDRHRCSRGAVPACVTASAKAESASDFRRRYCLPMRADRRA
jgi:hypothetical protein